LQTSVRLTYNNVGFSVPRVVLLVMTVVVWKAVLGLGVCFGKRLRFKVQRLDHGIFFTPK
jgi:hypothetical protein